MEGVLPQEEDEGIIRLPLHAAGRRQGGDNIDVVFLFSVARSVEDRGNFFRRPRTKPGGFAANQDGVDPRSTQYVLQELESESLTSCRDPGLVERQSRVGGR